MKKANLFLLLSIYFLTFSQTNIILKNSWLQTGTPYTLYTSQRMQDALATLTSAPINLDISGCISNIQSGNVTNQPTFGINNSQPNGTDWMLDYHSAFTYYGLNHVFEINEFGATVSNPGGDSYTGQYSQVSTVLNSNAGIPWNSSGNVDINTVLRHEIGHLYGLDDYEEWGVITLMNPLEKDYVNYLDQNSINGLRIIFEQPSTTIVGNSVIKSGDAFSYNINFPIIEYGPDFGETPDGFGFHSYLYKDESFLSNIPLIPIHVETYEDGTQLYTNSISTSSLTLGNYSVRTYSAMFWNQDGYLSWYENYNRPYSEVSFKVVAAPTIEFPLPNEIYHVRPSGEKGSVTDTLAIKVRVPQILGSYPDINIKIDDVYVNPGDITFDSEENVWVYNWDVSAETPTEYGKRYSIKAEIDGDPTDYDATSVYLVEALFYEDFQTIADFASAAWTVETYIYPVSTPYGWKLGLDLITAETGTRCAKSIYTYSLSFYDMLRTPAITIPSDPNIVTKLSYRLAYKKGTTAVNLSKLYFNIYDENDNQITFNSALATVAGSWIDVEYDLSSYAGQTIKLNWKHHYASTTTYCENTQFAIDDVKVFQIPDMDSPNIDFIAGNVADLNEDMNLTLQFNDNSGIESVTADYSIEEDSNTITLYPVKGTYNYTGVIPARDHECNGSISYRIVDSVGNETVSGGHGIYWALSGGGILSAPENVVITTDDTTIALTWDIVDGATGYKVYSSLDPYGTFAEDSTGTFTESRKWEKTIDGNKFFYYIIATDAVKEEEIDILDLEKTEDR